MKSHVINPPLDIMNKISVKRAGNAEVGPLDLYKILSEGNRYKIIYDYDNENIKVSTTNEPMKHKIYKNKIHDKPCKPLYIKDYKWYNPGTLSKKLSKEYFGTTDKNANVFGESGIMKIHKKYSFTIPQVNILDCEKTINDIFGVKLFAPGETLPKMNIKNQKVYLVSYKINEQYATKYVHDLKGPGIFLEYHNFPHYVTPIGKDSRGPFVIGKFRKGGGMDIIGINIPLGHTLYIPPNIIHNDWYFIGKLATTVLVGEESDTVFLRGINNKKIPMEFISKPGTK